MFWKDWLQPPARISFLENSRDFFLIFTSCSRSRAILVSLSILEKEWKEFIFHFSLLEKSESYLNFTLFSREIRVKSGTGYDLTSLYLPKLYFFLNPPLFVLLHFLNILMVPSETNSLLQVKLYKNSQSLRKWGQGIDRFHLTEFFFSDVPPPFMSEPLQLEIAWSVITFPFPLQ